VNPHHVDADPYPYFHFDADPDQSFHFDADQDPSFKKKKGTQDLDFFWLRF
jgi:hypothetical protein